MTKSELIKKISIRAGVTEFSAKDFFNLFLKRIPDYLSLGESLKISNIGFFHFRKGKLKKQTKLDENEPEFEFLDLLIFSPGADINLKSHNNLIFSVPSEKIEDEVELDTHFSLSIEKPVLPTLDDRKPETEKSETEEEPNESIESKVDKFISKLDKTYDGVSETDILLVRGGLSDEDQLELELDEQAKEVNKQKLIDNKIHSSDMMKSIAWDFGKRLSKRVEEESLLNKDDETKKEKPVSKEEQEDIIPWEFGNEKSAKIDLNKPSLKIKVENEKPVEPHVEEKTFDLVSESTPIESRDDNLVEDITVSDIKMDEFMVSDKDGSEKIGKYERVRSVSSKFGKTEQYSSEVKGIKDFIKDTENKKEKDEKDFEKVESKAKHFNSAGTDKEKLEKKKDKKPKEIKLNRFEKNKRKKIRRNSSLPFFIFLISIIAVAGIIYVLFKGSGKSYIEEDGSIPVAERNLRTTYVERSYEIPVTYPYNKTDNEVEISGINSSLLRQPEIKEKKIKKNEQKEEITNTKPVKNVKSEEPEKTPEVNFTQVESTIFKYNNNYVVQVAAFRHKNVAEKEASKYVKHGYNAFVEKATLTGRGTWYRVRIGYFNTLEEARKFMNSNRNK